MFRTVSVAVLMSTACAAAFSQAASGVPSQLDAFLKSPSNCQKYVGTRGHDDSVPASYAKQLSGALGELMKDQPALTIRDALGAIDQKCQASLAAGEAAVVAKSNSGAAK